MPSKQWNDYHSYILYQINYCDLLTILIVNFKSFYLKLSIVTRLIEIHWFTIQNKFTINNMLQNVNVRDFKIFYMLLYGLFCRHLLLVFLWTYNYFILFQTTNSTNISCDGLSKFEEELNITDVIQDPLANIKEEQLEDYHQVMKIDDDYLYILLEYKLFQICIFKKLAGFFIRFK